MGRMQRNKGASFERAVANLLKPVFPDAKRGFGQARDAGEVPDVAGTPYWIECKAHRQVSIQAAFGQAVAAIKKHWDYRSATVAAGQIGNPPPLVISKDNGGPILVTCSLEHFLALVRRTHELHDTAKDLYGEGLEVGMRVGKKLGPPDATPAPFRMGLLMPGETK